MKVFRQGGFGTLDEFCNLKHSVEDHEAVDVMRRITTLVLGLHDPEKSFEESDYYPFIQKLFCKDLKTLNPNITVLSFNYDVYLDYLLVRALEARGANTQDRALINSVTGGFAFTGDRGWLETPENRFHHLKLHGSTDSITQGQHELFESFADQRVNYLYRKAKERKGMENIPILFPWDRAGGSRNSSLVKNLIQPIWSLAGRKVSEADKISFVGLSLNPLLDDGFLELFGNFVKPRAYVVVNPLCSATPAGVIGPTLAPTHPARRLDLLLKKAVPTAASLPVLTGQSQPGAIRALGSFRDFIEEEV